MTARNDVCVGKHLATAGFRSFKPVMPPGLSYPAKPSFYFTCRRQSLGKGRNAGFQLGWRVSRFNCANSRGQCYSAGKRNLRRARWRLRRGGESLADGRRLDCKVSVGGLVVIGFRRKCAIWCVGHYQ